jgi:hypothetical protein
MHKFIVIRQLFSAQVTATHVSVGGNDHNGLAFITTSIRSSYEVDQSLERGLNHGKGRSQLTKADLSLVAGALLITKASGSNDILPAGLDHRPPVSLSLTRHALKICSHHTFTP